MICENCKIDSEAFGPICSICGSEIESAPGAIEHKIPDSSLTETPVENKILTDLEKKKNRAIKIHRFLWFID